jgi:hypothetical protein
MKLLLRFAVLSSRAGRPVYLLPPTRHGNSALLVLALGLALAACVAPLDDEPVDEPTSQTEQSLLASNWSAPAQVSANTVWFAQVATLGGKTYMVHEGPGYVMSWRQLVGNVWTEPTLIPGQTTGQRVSLAPFNGFLYMVRTDLNQATKLWVSRFTPATGQWSTSFQIPHTSFQPPALAAFGTRLYLIGVDPSTKMLWSATMTADEAFTVASPMYGQYSAARVSAAVFKCKLYIAHRAGNTLAIVYNSFSGATWGTDQTIPAGAGGAAIQGGEPVIAERAGYLHLLHRDTVNNTIAPVWWTYFNGTSWPSEIALGSVTTYYHPSLTAGGAGLVAINTTYYNSIASSMQFTQPLPFTPPTCGVAQP